MSRIYLIEKLSDINYRMAIHEGNANRRLASEAIKILLLPTSEVPDSFKKEFHKLRNLAKDTIKNLPALGLTPTKLGNIRNKTAAKYIKILIDIEENTRYE